MSRARLLVDTGPLIALANRRDRFHAIITAFLDSFFGELLTTWAVLTETTHQIPSHLVVPFLRLARSTRLRVIDLPGALPRIEELIQKYADHPMDLADASLVWVAEQTGVVDILTLDVGDFGTYRLKSGKRFNILPG